MAVFLDLFSAMLRIVILQEPVVISSINSLTCLVCHCISALVVIPVIFFCRSAAIRIVFTLDHQFLSSRHLSQQLQDVLLDCLDVRFDLLQRARRRVLVEVAVERNLVADLRL